MDHLLLLILGIFLSTLGTVNIKGNISTIHSYNRRKVKEEDVPKYGKALARERLSLVFPSCYPISSHSGMQMPSIISFFRRW